MARRQMDGKGNLLEGEQAKRKWPQDLGQQQDPAKKPVTNQIKSPPATDQRPTYTKNCLSASTPSGQTRVLARVFAMIEEEVTAYPSVVSIKLTIYDTTAYALIDSGTTHSFASPTCMRRLGCPR